MRGSRSGDNLNSAVMALIARSSRPAGGETPSLARDGNGSVRLLASLTGEFATRDRARSGSPARTGPAGRGRGTR